MHTAQHYAYRNVNSVTYDPRARVTIGKAAFQMQAKQRYRHRHQLARPGSILRPQPALFHPARRGPGGNDDSELCVVGWSRSLEGRGESRLGPPRQETL